MKEDDKKPIEIFAYSGATELRSGIRRDTLEGVRKGTVFVAPVSGRVLIHKGNKDLGEDPNVTTGVSMFFSHTDGKAYRSLIESAGGIEITSELQSLILVQGERPEGVQVKKGQPLLKTPGDNQTVVFTTELLQK